MWAPRLFSPPTPTKKRGRPFATPWHTFLWQHKAPLDSSLLCASSLVHSHQIPPFHTYVLPIKKPHFWQCPKIVCWREHIKIIRNQQELRTEISIPLLRTKPNRDSPENSQGLPRVVSLFLFWSALSVPPKICLVSEKYYNFFTFS